MKLDFIPLASVPEKQTVDNRNASNDDCLKLLAEFVHSGQDAALVIFEKEQEREHKRLYTTAKRGAFKSQLTVVLRSGRTYIIRK